MINDPFRHVPELRDQITPFDQSIFRQDFPAYVRSISLEKEIDTSDLFEDAERNAMHAAFVTSHSGDLWVFAYGSLIWDPALDFAEVRRATLRGYARKMCLVDTMGVRGSADAPGLMAGLAQGDHCHGMAFRIPEARVAEETNYLWQREMIAPGYLPTMLDATTPQGPIRTLAFVADLENPMMQPDLPLATQAQYIAQGEGELGSSYDYTKSIVERFEILQIDDPELRSLFEQATALRSSR